MERVVENLQVFSQDEENRFMEEMIEKQERDQLSLTNQVREEGMKQGI